MVDLVKMEERRRLASDLASELGDAGFISWMNEAYEACEAISDAQDALSSARAEIERLRGQNGKLRILASYIAGTNDDEIRVALAGNPTACDSLISLAAALIREQEE